MNFKRILLAALISSLSFGIAHADNNNRFSVGYANTNLKFADGESSNLKGFNIKYQYEFLLILALSLLLSPPAMKIHRRDSIVMPGVLMANGYPINLFME
ncbi:TPA: hypothetical protein ACP60M_003809 [Escherichia coli]